MSEAAQKNVKIPVSRFNYILFGIGALIIIFMIVLLCTSFADLPAQVPTHWNIAGEADNFGSKYTYLWIPLIGILLYAGLSVLSFFPQYFNYPVAVTENNASALYAAGRIWMNIINLETLLIFAGIFYCDIRAAMGNGNLTGAVVMIICALSLLTCLLMILHLSRTGREI